jgi:prevent-host-death family protein
MKLVPSTEANRSFSKLLARAAKGETVAITVRGKIVARIVPDQDYNDVALAIRRREHIEQLRRQPALNLPRVTRDDMYD